jgi:hypothetical protein
MGTHSAKVTPLEGSFQPFSEEFDGGQIERATYIVRDETGQEFTLVGRESDSETWEAHLFSTNGRSFSGEIRYKGWDYKYYVEMELWLSPIDAEMMLLGTWRGEDEDPVHWSILLWPREED